MSLAYGTIYGDFGDEKITSTDNFVGADEGTRMILPDGRVYRYAFTDGAVTAGKLVTPGAGVANHDMDLVTAAAAVGATSINVTLGATAATADQYKGGYIYVNDGAGEGHTYRIAGHDAISSAAAGDIRLADGDRVAVAVTAASLCGLVANPYKDVVISATTPIHMPIGVTATDLADNAFGWIQTWGPCALLCDVAFVVGNHIRVSDNVAGSAEPLDRDGTAEDEIAVGSAFLIAPVSTDYGMVFLQISP